MSEPTENDRDELAQNELDPNRAEALRRAMAQTAERLRERGVRLTGRESSEQLVTMLEAVERFELAVESRGGDLMVDEGPHGQTREPDDVHFVLPRREPGEPVANYLARLEQATLGVRRHQPHEG